LTRQVIEDVSTSLRTGTPINWACEYVGISRGTYHEWMETARAARLKSPGGRTQRERLCVAFAARCDQAIADHAMRANMVFQRAAGMTTELPKRRRTTLRISARGGEAITIGENGQVSGGTIIEAITVEEELAPDYRAIDRHLSKRHRDEWYARQELTGDAAPGGDDGPADAPREISGAELAAVLEQARARAGITVGDVIDVASYPADGPAELSAAVDEDRG
jgi:hypothetical protein